jgi:MYXO-CTERM domain-containing protein
MKSFSRSISRGDVSASSVFVAAVALSAAAPAVAGIYMNNTVQRYATAAGLTDNYFRGSVSFRAGDTMLSATRPNGQTNWPQKYGMWQITTPQGPGFLTGAQIDSWMDSNARGTFSSTWSTNVGDYPGTYQSSGDFAPYYVAPTAMSYLELTQSSITQFNNICANGLTGTFTFNTTQDVAQAGLYTASMFLSGSNGAVFSPTVSSGNTLTVDITSALSANTGLYLSGTTRDDVVFQETTNYPYPGDARYNYETTTVYRSAPVPAPGALALLALAGAAGGRRRRG